MTPVAGANSPITPEMMTAIDYIFQKTIDVDTYDLVEMSHIPGGPWERAYNPNDENHGQIIPKNSMFRFYQTRDILSKI